MSKCFTVLAEFKICTVWFDDNMLLLFKFEKTHSYSYMAPAGHFCPPSFGLKGIRAHHTVMTQK